MSASWDEARRDSRFARGAGGGPLWHFLKGFIKHPVMVGSIIPSSKAVIDKMLAPVDWANCKLFVEYGPGVGTFTEHVLRRMAPDATLIAIDTNAGFRPLSHAPSSATTGCSRSTVRRRTCGRSSPIAASTHADYILSGLPFSTLPAGRRPEDRRADRRGAAPGRRLPGLPVQGQGARFHGAPFRPHRPRLRMGQHPALPPVLGLEGQ